MTFCLIYTSFNSSQKPISPFHYDVQPVADTKNVSTDPIPYQEDLYSTRNFKYAQIFYLVGLIILVVVMVHAVEYLTSLLLA